MSGSWIPVGPEIDEAFERMGPAHFVVEHLEGGVRFTGTWRRALTPGGRTLVPVEDLVGLLDAQIEAGGTVEDCRRFLVNATMAASPPQPEDRET